MGSKARQRLQLLQRLAASVRNPTKEQVTIGGFGEPPFLGIIAPSVPLIAPPISGEDSAVVSRQVVECTLEYPEGMQKVLSIRSKSVLELGAGMAGLAGLALGAGGLCSQILVTDGNPDSVRNVAWNIAINEKIFSQVNIAAQQYIWGQECEEFDVVIGADLTYLTESHDVLAATLQQTVKYPDGVCYMFCCSRGGSLEAFLKILEEIEPSGTRKKLKAEIQRQYDDLIWDRHLHEIDASAGDADIYNPDKEYPVKITIYWE
ncbi:hypothetical protein HDU83_006809 [Entophlyctis luteolus]|nr:hypothetical protein HDU83_006809 [Entophlyctis luteolus]